MHHQQQLLINLLREALPGILEIRWGVHGYPNKTYTGILFATQCVDEGPARLEDPIGVLTDPEQSRTILTAKLQILWARPEIASSLEERDPKNGLWGGAVRATQYRRLVSGMTGVPELADHLTQTHAQYLCGWITREERDCLCSEKYLEDALADRNMSYTVCQALSKRIREILEAALGRLSEQHRLAAG